MPYYKITNKKCSLYKKLHKQRTVELQAIEENNKVLEEIIPYEWDQYNGWYDNSYGRIPQYWGFVFKKPEEVDPKVWRTNPEYPGAFFPNRRYKGGREMYNKLINLKRFSFLKLVELMGMEFPTGRCAVPYLEIANSTLLIMLDDRLVPTDKNMIEITKKEFRKIAAEAGFKFDL